MNSKQAKRLRRILRQHLSVTGAVVGDRPERDSSTWDIHLVPAFQKHSSVTVGKGTPDEKVYDDAAIQVRLTPTSPRAMLKRIKRNVQTNR